MTAAALIQNETTLGAAITMRNREVLSALTHPSFTYWGFHSDGLSAWNRSEWLNAVTALQTTSFVHSTVNTLIVGGTAIVSVDATWLGKSPGAPSQQRILMSDTWLKVSGRWRLLRRHASNHDGVEQRAAPTLAAEFI